MKSFLLHSLLAPSPASFYFRCYVRAALTTCMAFAACYCHEIAIYGIECDAMDERFLCLAEMKTFNVIYQRHGWESQLTHSLTFRKNSLKAASNCSFTVQQQQQSTATTNGENEVIKKPIFIWNCHCEYI